jgi:hypothetical protein
VRVLPVLDDLELLGILRSLPRSSERRAAACEVLVGRYRNLVRSCVRRYRRSPEPNATGFRGKVMRGLTVS